MRKQIVFTIRPSSEVAALIEEAVAKTKLTKSLVIDRSLLLGVPDLVRRLTGKRPLVDYLDAFSELPIKPDRSPLPKSRFPTHD